MPRCKLTGAGWTCLVARLVEWVMALFLCAVAVAGRETERAWLCLCTLTGVGWVCRVDRPAEAARDRATCSSAWA